MSDVIEDGRKARQLLNSTAFKDSIALVKAKMFSQWEDARRLSEREDVAAELRGLNRVIKHLEITAERGKHAEK